MRYTYAAICSAVAASAMLNMRQIRPNLAAQMERLASPLTYGEGNGFEKRQAPAPKFLTDRTRRFAVNGTSIPEVDFDVGESYAGLLPISEDINDPNQLYFWFFPSTSPVAEKEILIWITGGPGCSSTGELMQENGPFLWAPGVFKPVANVWSWHHLTNVVWIDQPIGAGFSQGTPTARNEDDVARQLMGFWRNFIDTFSMQGFKVYVTGSSYSGIYCPYVASAMLDANDKTYFDVAGMMVFDGLFSHPAISQEIPMAAFAQRWQEPVFAFNDSFASAVAALGDQCGYSDYLREFLVFPPAGVQPQPEALPGNGNAEQAESCSAINLVFSGAAELNPCFSVYDIFAQCPLKLDPLGFSAGSNFLPESFGPVFLNRDDVKRAINAPVDTEWVFCAEAPVFVDGVDESINAGPGSMPVLPNVIDRTQNVIIGHGARDFVLVAEGTLLSIQNLTWGGQLGFQARPTAPLYVPYHANEDPEALAGAGVVGTAHTERGLTYFGVASAGHFLTQDQPAIAFRALEVLLGRVESLQAIAPFTTDLNATAQPSEAMGNGTVAAGLLETSTNGPVAALGSSGQLAAQTSSAWARTCSMRSSLAVAMIALFLLA